jgi:flagellar basal-body rod modification protein FlgD
MFSVKGGTQHWSNSVQQSGLKAEPGESMSAQQREQVLGDKDLGEYLNKVADPNWVDPVKTRRVGNSELGKDAFLKLLLAQMKNQDPTNPMQSHEMSAQLAQFTSLEKLTNIDDSIGKLTQKENPAENYHLLNLMGKSIQGDSSKVLRMNKNETHNITFNLPREGQEADLLIRNANGDIVREQKINNLKMGENSFAWNGIDDQGETAPEGEYSVQIEVKDSFGKKIAPETSFGGIVTGVNFTAQGPVLMIGNKSVKLKDVKSFGMPGAHNQSAEASTPSLGGKSLPMPEQGQPLGGVAMSRGLLNKITKETLPDSKKETVK